MMYMAGSRIDADSGRIDVDSRMLDVDSGRIDVDSRMLAVDTVAVDSTMQMQRQIGHSC
jgi:hypothetical protein